MTIEEKRVEDGRMSGRCAVKQWGLLADFTIPYMACSAEKPNGKDE